MADKTYTPSVEAYNKPYTGPNHGNEGWSPDDPIMADMMNNIEAGIVEAIKLNSELETLLNGISAAATTALSTASAAASQALTAYNNVESYKNQILHGDYAWSAVKFFTNITNDDSSSVNNAMAAKNNLISSMDSILQAAAGTYTDPVTHAKSLPARLDAMTQQLGLHDTGISGLTAEITAAKQTPEGTNPEGYHLVDNINAIKASIKAVSDEIEAAHRQTGDTLKDYFDTLKGRLDAIDITDDGADTIANRLAAVENEIGPLANSYIDQLKTEVGEAHRENIDGGDTLKKRFEALEESLGTTSGDLTTLTGRVDNIATEIDNANGDGTLSERLSGIDSAIAGISGENGSIASIETRLDAIDTDEGNLVSRVSALETEVDMTSASSRIDLIRDEIDNAHRTDLPNDELDTLAKRFTAIDGKIAELEAGGGQGSSATIIVDDATFVDGVPVLPEGQTASKDIDYLIKNGDKYYYWKYINNKWELISGGGSNEGGTGTSSASIVAELPTAANADPNIDYYVGNNLDGYIHYRYIPSEQEGENGVFITILPKKLTNNLDNLINNVGVKSILITTADAVGETPAVVATVSGGIEAYAIADTAHNSNLYANFTALRAARLKKTYKEDGTTLDKQYLIFTDTNGTENSIEIVGGGGAGSSYTVRLVNALSALSFSVATSLDVVNISAKPIINFGTTLAEGLDIIGNVQYKLSTDSVWRNSNIALPTINNNEAFTVNIASILGAKDTTTDIRLSISVTPDGENGETFTQYITYHITKVEMTIEALGYNSAVVRNGTSFMLDYVCYGLNLQKTVYFKIDGNIVATENIGTSHNETLHQSIPLTYMENDELQFISDGMHTFQVYFEASGNSSNILNYYLIYNRDSERVAPLVGVAFEKTDIHYGDELKFNYTVYTAGQDTTDRVKIELYTMENGSKVLIDEDKDIILLNVTNSRVEQYTILEYPQKTETYKLYVDFIAEKIIPAENEGEDPTVLATTETISIDIKPFQSNYELKYAGTDALLYSYSAYGRTNNDADKEIHTYTFNTHDANYPTLTFTTEFNDFNWSTNGYVDGALTISGGATCDINVPVFSATYDDVSIEGSDSTRDITERGRTVEIDYEVVSAINLNDTIISCMNPNSNAGFKITPQNCYLTSNNRPAIISDDGTGNILNEASIAAAYLTTGQRTHLVFVIEPWATTKAYDNKFHQSVNIYLNGEFANASPYFRDNSSGAITDTFTTDATIHIGNSSCIIKLYSVKLYNRGLSPNEVLQNYKMAPRLTTDKIARFDKNNVIKNNKVDYELARKQFNCLLLVGPEPDYVLNAQGYPYNRIPTISPYKGAPSPINRMSGDEVVGKTESGLIFTMPDDTNESGFVYGFKLLDKLRDRGYASSNNVQGTSSQKYPIHNLKVYLAKGKEGTEVFDIETTISVKEVYKYSITTAATKAYKAVYPDTDAPSYITKCASNIASLVEALNEVPTQAEVVEMIVDYLTTQDASVGAIYTNYSTGDELITHPLIGYEKSDKVKYRLPGAKYSKGESTLCWKADYMSTDHANTFNANIADNLFTDSLNPNISNETWKSSILNTVHGIRCLLFKQEGSQPIEFVADGCLNNDKGNSKSYGLEYSGDDGANTTAQKWEFTNNSDDLGFFKYDAVFYPTGKDQHYRAKDAFESCFPDQGDLEDAQDAYKAAHNNEEDPNLNPNYNHLQVLLTWVSQRANYWEASSEITGETYTYDGISYNNLRDYKQAIFKKEFGWHFNLDHVLTYYVFSEYVALCDNRVKNMFMRSDTIRNEVIKLTNGDVLYKGNENPNADFWKHFIDINTGAINKQSIITNITQAYMAVHTDLEEETTPEYAETVANLVADYAAQSATKLTMEQVQNLIVQYLATEELAVSEAYISSRQVGSEEVVYERMMANADQINWLYDATDTNEIPAETSRFAIWAPVLYDLDSCFGVENVGYLKIPYNADWQYYQDGQYLFNGHDSIFWLMVEDSFSSEIYTKAKRLYDRDDGLNYHNFYNVQITDNNKAIAPAMTNQDMILKFDEPWATGFMNYSNKPPTYETPEYKYLQRGSRAAQKDAFMFKRSMLLSSKYQADAFLNDRVSFRYGADLSSAEAVIECSANQIMYPAVSFGDNKGWTQALELVDGTPVIGGYVDAGKKCRIRATSSAKGQDTLFIAGASVLTDIGDLSVFKPYEIKVGYCKNLKKLIFGSSAAGYSNEVTDSIGGLSSCALLEEINIRNCKNINNLDLSANGLIKTVYASGSGATTISLPAGGVLETLELGDSTATIKLVNQSYFQNFSYLNSETNHYENVKELWIENTDNVPIKDIVVNRLASSSFEGLRLVGIDINVGEDTLMLDLLATDDYTKGKFINADGGRDRNRHPYISGTITVRNLRKSIYNTLKSKYPELTVNVTGQLIPEFALNYMNVDAQGNETLLITLYRASDQTIPDPVVEQDPITGKYYIENSPAALIGNDGTQIVPLRQADAQYKYRFGTYNNRGEYNKYSGWYIKELAAAPTASTSINMNYTILAQYPDVSREVLKYTVTWYDDDGALLERQENVPYGFDAGLYTPPGKDNAVNYMEVKKLKNGVYKVFKGWDTPASIVRGDINIHSLWYEFDGNFSNFTNLDDLNPAGLYALTQIDVNQRNNLLQSHLATDMKYITLGHDFEYVDIPSYNLLDADEDYHYFNNEDSETVMIYNGTNNRPNIYPLASLKSDFTLALDFKFILSQTLWNRAFREYVLASCYLSVGGSISGFRVVLSKSNATLPAIRVYWGNNYVDIDNAIIDDTNGNYQTFRNMIVLRHNSDDPTKLYVYYAPQGTSPMYYNISDTTIQYTELEWSSSVAVNNPLILGGNLNESGNIENTQNGLRNATGAVFFAKYWLADLGVDDCSKLARWPHERLAYRIIGYDNGDSDNNKLIVGDSLNTKINFMAAETLGDRWINYGTERDAAFTGDNSLLLNGWHNSRVREFLNEILYNAFPTAYQSLFNKIIITSMARLDDSTNDSVTQPRLSSLNSQDYIYLPAYYEVDSTVPVGSEYRYEVNRPWNHLDVDNIQNVYTLSGGRLVKETSGLSLNYLRFFFQREVPVDARIFHLSTNPYGQQYLVDNIPITVRAGDIWYDDTNAYIYAGVEDVQQGITIDETKAHGTGEGWSPAVISALRTFNYSAYAGRRRNQYFGKILRNGSVSMTYDSLSGVNNRALLPEFSI